MCSLPAVQVLEPPVRQVLQATAHHASKGRLLSAEGPDLIAAIRRIVDEKSSAMINGAIVDLFTASAIVQVYDALSPAHQSKMLAMNVARMADVAMRVYANAGR